MNFITRIAMVFFLVLISVNVEANPPQKCDVKQCHALKHDLTTTYFAYTQLGPDLDALDLRMFKVLTLTRVLMALETLRIKSDPEIQIQIKRYQKERKQQQKQIKLESKILKERMGIIQKRIEKLNSTRKNLEKKCGNICKMVLQKK